MSKALRGWKSCISPISKRQSTTVRRFTIPTKMPLITQNPKNRLILGCMTFGDDASAGARVTSLDDYNKCLDYLQSQGYNEIDTARAYIGGKQEGWTRQANWQDRGLTLATKHYPFQPGEHKPEKIRAALETSLKELGGE